MKEYNINEGYTKAMMVFINMAKRYGAKLVTSKGKHLKFRDALGHQISAPKTTSDFRAIRNFQSELRNKGFVDSQAKRVVPAQPKASATQPAPTAKQRYEAGEKLTTGNQTTFKDFMQKVDTARTNTAPASGPKPAAAPVQSASTSTTAQRMAQGYDQNIAPVINRRGREVLSSIQRRERLVNKFGSVKEGMLPVPSDKRKRIINPMVAAMPPKTTEGINKAMKKGLEDLNTKYQRLYDMLNSVPKDRGKA